MRAPPLPFRLIRPLAVCLLTACIQDQSASPDLGPCADEVTRGATYGQVGIGTCLAGPTDLRFVERSGRTWLAVSNADPFINFDSGSVLLLDWAEITGRLDDEVLLTAGLEAEAVPTERFVGAMGEIRDRGLLLTTRRLTEGGRTRTGEDSAYVIDLEAGALWEDGASIPLKDDPGSVAVQDSTGRAFVLNYTDHSVSVVATDTTPLIPVDLAPDAMLEIEGLSGSDGLVELDRVDLLDEAEVPDDVWTLTWLPGQVRLFAPEGSGLNRWSSGGADYLIAAQQPIVNASPIGIETLIDPVVGSVFLGATSPSATRILYSNGESIFETTNIGGSGGDDWDLFPLPLLSGSTEPEAWDAFLTGPSLSFPNGVETLYYSGAAEVGGTASIGAAFNEDGITFNALSEPILSMPGVSLEQPFVQVDRRSVRTRMWVTMRSATIGGRYDIGYAESDDGLNFSEPVSLELDQFFYDIAAPVVRWDTGLYRMWATVRTSATAAWRYAEFESVDGIEWDFKDVVIPPGMVEDSDVPPRAAVHVEPSSIWRVEGADTGASSTPAVTGFRYTDFSNGFTFTVTSGHEIANTEFANRRAANGVEPNSHVFHRSFDRLYLTLTGDDGRNRIGALEGFADSWNILGTDLIPANTGGNVSGVRNATVFDLNGDESLFVMFYTALDENGLGSLRMATSTDALNFEPVGEALLAEADIPNFAAATMEARSVRPLEDGGLEVWISGNDGSRWRIGALVDPDFDPTNPQFSLSPGEFTEHQLAGGLPGGIDDSGVKDPMVFTELDDDGNETLRMVYSGNDGLTWHLGMATFDPGSQTWIRRIDDETDATLPSMQGVSRTFSTAGVDNPVARLRSDGLLEVWYAGSDDVAESGGIPRLGKALGRGDQIYPEMRQPAFGDTFTFQTHRGDDVVSVIELAQNLADVQASGIGTTSLILDEDRGFIYIPSKLSNQVYVVDIRDDSSPEFTDRNALDLESRIRFPTLGGTNGFRGGVISEARDRLYLTMRNPDGVAVVDLNSLEDNGEKEVEDSAVIGFLPMQDNSQDAGENSVAAFSGGEPAINGDLLVVPHFRDNSVSIFDLGIGPYGEEVAYIPHVGENPHLVRISPDGNWAVVANYLGDLDGEQANATLALIDMNPNSQTYLTVTNWIKNK